MRANYSRKSKVLFGASDGKNRINDNQYRKFENLQIFKRDIEHLK